MRFTTTSVVAAAQLIAFVSSGGTAVAQSPSGTITAPAPGAATTPSPASGTAAPQTPKVDPVLQRRFTLPSGESQIVATALDAASLPAMTSLIQLLGGTVGRPLGIIQAVAATVPNTALLTLAASAAVGHLALDRPIAGTMERTGLTIGATAVRQQLGLNGSGIGVAVIDSGIAAGHDDLADAVTWSPRVDQFVDFVGNLTMPYDDYGHGTHVAGIIAGSGFDSDGARAGIAPGVRLVALKVLDGTGRGRISDVIAALDYIVAHRTELNTRIINLSVATAVHESYYDDPLTLAARSAVDAGIVLVASAGNAGRTSEGKTQYGGITAPGNAPWVLTVGASSHMGTIDRADDTIAAFSSRGPTAINRAAKPDLVAPGVGIESLSAPNSTLYQTRSSFLLAGTRPTSYLPYLSLSGTSQSAPVVAGTVALMLQANPALTPNAVKAVLQFTAQFYPQYDPLTQGTGFLNAAGAVSLARYLAAPSSSTAPDMTGWVRQLTWGNNRTQGGQFTAGANAWRLDTEWGATKSSLGEPIAWGVICVAGCDGPAPQWAAWQVPCGDASCNRVDWAAAGAPDVVWGMQCGGVDCPSGTVWSTTDQTVVWGTNSSETVVWGTTDGETVVWGTNDPETVVWGTTCADPSCQPTIWNH